MKYLVKVPYQGYSRGDDIYEVEAKSEAHAEELVKNYGGEFIERDICRDDTEKDMDNAYCIGESNE